MNRITWKEKYLISLNDELTTSDISKLFSVGRNTARELRYKALELENRDANDRKERPLTSSIIAAAGKEKNYFLNKMREEEKAYGQV